MKTLKSASVFTGRKKGIPMKKNIAVFFGGASSEYEISLQSAYSVISHIDKGLYEPVLIGITRQGDFYLFEGDVEKILTDEWSFDASCFPAVLSQSKALHGILVFRGNNVQQLSLSAALPILHGKNGEDGTLQGALELAGIPCIGCGVLCSALCMDKDMAHRAAASVGVKVPASAVFHNPPDEAALFAAASKLSYPLFVKPMRAGSSFGITKVLRKEDLHSAVEEAFLYDNIILLEEMIEGFEVGCAVLGRNPAFSKAHCFGSDLIIGKVDEIELAEGYFDFTEKYQLLTSKIHVPARLSGEMTKAVKETARLLYQALGCDYFARIDLFITPSEEIYFNEVNTIPGFTSHSRFPNMLKAAGISFDALVAHLLSMGVSV